MSRFMTVSVAVLAAMFVVGTAIGMLGGITPNLAGILWFVCRVVLKFIGAIVLARLLTGIVCSQILGISYADLVKALHQRIDSQENLSPVFVLGGILLIAVQIFALAHATSTTVYFYDVLTKGSVGLLIGLVFTMIQSRRVGVVSAGHFADFYHDSSNNQIIAYVMLAMNAAVLVAMMS